MPQLLGWAALDWIPEVHLSVHVKVQSHDIWHAANQALPVDDLRDDLQGKRGRCTSIALIKGWNLLLLLRDGF